MSSVEKALGVIKAAMLMNERFDGIEEDMKNLAEDVTALGRSHSELAQRVARLEGLIEGAAMASGLQPRLPRA